MKNAPSPTPFTYHAGFTLIQSEDSTSVLDTETGTWWVFKNIRSARWNASVMRRHLAMAKKDPNFVPSELPKTAPLALPAPVTNKIIRYVSRPH